MQSSNLIYDGSFDGFLSAVFYVFEYKLESVSIQKQNHVQNELFGTNQTICTSPEKANRVWKGLKSRCASKAGSQLYYAFLSEKEDLEVTLLDYIRYVFANTNDVSKDFSNPSVLKTAQVAKMVGREKHRMEAFVRFKLTKDDLYFSTIAPDFNVLPLLLKHFKNRYADQKWVIYDVKRNYGLYYDLNTVEWIELEFQDAFDVGKTQADYFTTQEMEFQTLWQDYYSSTNIKSRKNMKLHLRHVPKRYWNYLSEKQPKI